MLTLSWAGGGTLCPDNFETYIANFFALLTPHIIHWLFIFYCVIYGETLILGKKCILGPQGGSEKLNPPNFCFWKMTNHALLTKYFTESKSHENKKSVSWPYLSGVWSQIWPQINILISRSKFMIFSIFRRFHLMIFTKIVFCSLLHVGLQISAVMTWNFLQSITNI